MYNLGSLQKVFQTVNGQATGYTLHYKLSLKFISNHLKNFSLAISFPPIILKGLQQYEKSDLFSVYFTAIDGTSLIFINHNKLF